MIFRVCVCGGIIAREPPDEIRTADSDERNNCQQHSTPLPTAAFRGLVCSVGHGRRMRLSRRWKLKRKINQSFFSPIDFAEINVWRDFADLVTDPVCQQ